MYSDTHFHFEHTVTSLLNENENAGKEILTQMVKNNCFFGLDIGTECNDLLNRVLCVDSNIEKITDSEIKEKAKHLVYFSSGIWPSVQEIKNRKQGIKTLKEQIQNLKDFNTKNIIHKKIVAIGECGLDHHWNPNGADERNENDFNAELYNAERELFQMQLELAKEMQLPVIIHSRDAFLDTLDCIKNVGYNNGIIHCYSYGLSEAEEFLKLGWYISFSGSVTYTKKSKMEEMQNLLKFIPKEKLLCETDSPYLAPVPLRGKTNTPPFVEHTYNFIAKARNISTDELCDSVDKNIKTLFNLTE